ncbi:hypothetical protein PR202_gb12648 [Eleusine coracana subsp. coracana]|uniref:Protein kinase domain-containing protein n=1 Tax=Eleusine coracana subsp. coracana TaxID=191504 RepID=A0AAV5ER22_ELECO|nr:hypothetical protein PR202_gb12648 [Eleusine coracana subsp. coracana]
MSCRRRAGARARTTARGAASPAPLPRTAPSPPSTCLAGASVPAATSSPRRGSLPSLTRLDLSGNALLGRIPPSLGALRRLSLLDLSNNALSGAIPASLGSATALRFLNLSNNALSGGDEAALPSAFRALTRLEELQISGNNLTGPLPSWLASLPNLRVLSAYENALSGPIPPGLGRAAPLQALNLHSNALSGPIPSTLFARGTLQVLVLTLNRLTGPVSGAIGRCRDLSNVRIGDNALSGAIPSSIGDAASLTYFEANGNLLTGGIPAEFARCANLTLLNLAFNRLTGEVPAALGGLRNLQELLVAGNALVGAFRSPTPVLRCRNLSKLDLSYNSFHGALPDDDLICSPRMQFLVLDHNRFSGRIPPGIERCTRLLALQLGSNNLSGEVPPEIGRVKSLQIALNLSFNHLVGPLPRELGRLDKLVTLDLSSNQISGQIPGDMRGMLSLIEVNLSNNWLTGAIPDFVPFQKSAASSFSGNPGLCGDPLDIACRGSVYDGSSGYELDRNRISYRVALAVAGSCVLIFSLVALLVALFMWRERQEKEAAEADKAGEVVAAAAAAQVAASAVFVESLQQAVDFQSCVKATFKDANILSNGTFSVTYEAVMPSGTVVCVKKLKSVDRAVVQHRSKMIRELERLAHITHPNLVGPIGYVIYEDVALLLHHHMPNGTLLQLLHGGDGGDAADGSEDRKPDWPRLLSIAIDVAQGLAFLHQVATIHLDISSGNVFLDPHYNALLGEVEISKLLDRSKGTASISAVAGTFGYIPPEYAYTMQVTVPGNVYSFGVVLLEILTSKLPADEGFGEGVDLVRWVHTAPARGETPEQIMDPRLSTVSFAWRRQMLAVLQVAMLCTEHSPAKRPKMKKVVEMLQDARKS